MPDVIAFVNRESGQRDEFVEVEKFLHPRMKGTIFDYQDGCFDKLSLVSLVSAIMFAYADKANIMTISSLDEDILSSVFGRMSESMAEVASVLAKVVVEKYDVNVAHI